MFQDSSVSHNGLISQDLRLRMKKNYMNFLIMFHDFRFHLGILTTVFTSNPLNVFFTWKNWVFFYAIFCVKTTFKAMVCQMCSNYYKTKSEIMKHYQKDYITFCIPNCSSWDFKSMLENAKPTSLDSSSDKPKAPIRNFGSQPFVIIFCFFFSPNLYSQNLRV